MPDKDYNPTLFEEGLGALAIAGVILSSLLRRSWYSKWGATMPEVEMTLPGDEFVPKPELESTRAITIQAPASEVWPWLAQMGQGRDGLYTYQRLENLVGCDMHNADQVISAYQNIKAGYKVRLVPEGGDLYFRISAIEIGKATVLAGDAPPTTWVFYLEQIDSNTTRLIVRWRQGYEPTFGNLIMWRLFTDPITFVMERKMLHGIKIRAESTESVKSN